MILCCGEALIDLIPDPDAAPARYTALPGGGPFNTAVALARLGLPTGFLCPLSTDAFGEQLAQHLLAEGVDLSPCPRTPAPTALAVLSLQQGQAQYSFHLQGTALSTLAAEHTLGQQPGAAVFGGIALTDPLGGAVCEGLFDRLRASGALTLIDPNIRPAVIQDPQSLRDRLARMCTGATIVKLSDEDLAWIAPQPEVALQRWRAAGVALIAVTLGAQGVRLLGRDLDLTLPAPAVPVCDTVGAGDSFNAGLLAGLWRQNLRTAPGLRQASPDRLMSAARLGLQVAALTVSRQGANPPRLTELGLD